MRAISILMSVFNEPETQLRESVASILKQTFQDFELIVVNDNPQRHDVETILDSFKDDRIIYYQNMNNVGLAMSMNKAAELAQSDLFARMDADDVAEKHRLEIDFKGIEKGFDVVFSGYTYIDENSKPIDNRSCPELSNQDIERKVMLDPSIIHHPTTMFRRSIFEKVGGYRNFPCSQDADLWLRMAEAGAKFHYLPDKLLHYRINSQSVSSKRWYKQQLTCNYIFDLSLERMLKNKDTYSYENYNQYLQQWGVDDSVSEAKLRESYRLLSEASLLASKGNIIHSLIIRARVFMISSLMRRHYMALKKKEHILKSRGL